MSNYIIGIDPDVERNGYAFIDMDTRKVKVETVSMPHLIELITILQATANAAGKKLTVYVEAGWLNQSNWHLDWRDNKMKAAAIGKSQGRNEQRGRDICELLTYRGITVVQVPPLKKIWKGKDRKITHDELTAIVGKIEHTNQEGRDAALLAWVNAGLPIIMKGGHHA